jgi:hypothetical protein
MGREIETPTKPKEAIQNSIQKAADGRLIFQETMDTRGVRRYANVVRDVMALRKLFEDESKQAPLPVLSELPASALFERAAGILETEELMLKHGFQGNKRLAISERINKVVEGYDLCALSADGVVDPDEDPEGVWKKTNAFIAGRVLEMKVTPPAKRKDEFHMGRVREKAEEVDIDESVLWHDPFRVYLTMLIDTETLAERQKRASEMIEDAELALPAIDRLRSVHHLTNAAIMALKDSVEAPMNIEAYARELNEGLALYGTRIVHSGGSRLQR